MSRSPIAATPRLMPTRTGRAAPRRALRSLSGCSGTLRPTGGVDGWLLRTRGTEGDVMTGQRTGKTRSGQYVEVLTRLAGGVAPREVRGHGSVAATPRVTVSS